MDITLYKNFSVHNKVNKNLTVVATGLGIQLPEPTDDYDIAIKFTVPTDTLKWSNVNYMSFDGAYYFIESVEKEFDGVSTVHGRMDLLMTFKDAIMSLRVQADRSTSHGSTRLADDERRVSVDSSRIVTAFPNQISGSESMGLYVLTTAQFGYEAG